MKVTVAINRTKYNARGQPVNNEVIGYYGVDLGNCPISVLKPHLFVIGKSTNWFLSLPSDQTKNRDVVMSIHLKDLAKIYTKNQEAYASLYYSTDHSVYACFASKDYGKTYSLKPILKVIGKNSIEDWIKEKSANDNLDYRVGFYCKFKDSATTYTWLSTDFEEAKV